MINEKYDGKKEHKLKLLAENRLKSGQYKIFDQTARLDEKPDQALLSRAASGEAQPAVRRDAFLRHQFGCDHRGYRRVQAVAGKTAPPAQDCH